MRKPAFCIMRKQRCRSAAWSPCSLSAPLISLHRQIRTIPKPLAIFCGCTDQFVLDLVRNPEDRFSHVVALVISTIILVMKAFTDIKIKVFDCSCPARKHFGRKEILTLATHLKTRVQHNCTASLIMKS